MSEPLRCERAMEQIPARTRGVNSVQCTVTEFYVIAVIPKSSFRGDAERRTRNPELLRRFRIRAGARPGMTCLVQKGVARMSEPLRCERAMEQHPSEHAHRAIECAVTVITVIMSA